MGKSGIRVRRDRRCQSRFACPGKELVLFAGRDQTGAGEPSGQFVEAHYGFCFRMTSRRRSSLRRWRPRPFPRLAFRHVICLPLGFAHVPMYLAEPALGRLRFVAGTFDVPLAQVLVLRAVDWRDIRRRSSAVSGSTGPVSDRRVWSSRLTARLQRSGSARFLQRAARRRPGRATRRAAPR